MLFSLSLRLPVCAGDGVTVSVDKTQKINGCESCKRNMDPSYANIQKDQRVHTCNWIFFSEDGKKKIM